VPWRFTSMRSASTGFERRDPKLLHSGRASLEKRFSGATFAA
jgi:hypothetical protein